VHVTVTPPLTVAGRVGTNGRSKSIRTQTGRKQVVTDSTNLQVIPFSEFLQHAGPSFDRVVGLVGYGLSTGTWTIGGITGRFKEHTWSVVSTYLVRQQSATAEEYRLRLTKVALHEFGHGLGLPHCGNTSSTREPTSEYSDRITTVTKGDPRCFMLESTPDGRQWYATTNQLCKPCHSRIQVNAKPVSFLRASHP
jgi:hypothetical protein